jgi:guanylate kinase
MVQRLEARMTESPEELKLRIATARQEMQRLGEFDYAVVNAEDRLDDTVDTILAIIKAEHCRVHPRQVTL